MKIDVRAALLLALPLLAACDDGSGPEGDVSTFEVQVYVESGDSAGFNAGDTPVSATVTVASNFDDQVLVAETGTDGTVTFADIPAGGYTVSHVATDGAGGATLQGSAVQTVVAPFAGDSVLTRFIYAFVNGAVSGVVFRDDNGSGAFEEGQDSVFAGVALELFEGGSATGTPVATATSDATGAYAFADIEQGAYTLSIDPVPNTEIVGANPRPVAIVAGETTEANVEITGDPTGELITIAAARDSAVGDTVKVQGTVTAGQGTYRDDSFYVQDSTSGIFVFGLPASRGLAVGDSVQVYAERWMFRQEAYLTVISVVELGTGEVPAPRTITTGDLNDGLFQGELATLSATVDSLVAGDGGLEVWVHDASGDAIVFADNDADIANTEFTVGAVQSITGVLGTFDRDDDLTIDAGDYQLRPRSADDVD